MATVFSHITDVTKRVIDYVEQRLDELEDEWNRLDDQRMMWEEFRKLKIKGTDKSFISEQIHACKKAAREVQAESEEYGRLIKALDPCDECGGTGELIEHISQDESVTHTCNECGGKGYGAEVA